MTPETTRHTFTPLEIKEANCHYYGYCMECRTLHGCCEPDARSRICEACGEPAVYGAHWIEINAPIESEV